MCRPTSGHILCPLALEWGSAGAAGWQSGVTDGTGWAYNYIMSQALSRDVRWPEENEIAFYPTWTEALVEKADSWERILRLRSSQRSDVSWFVPVPLLSKIKGWCGHHLCLCFQLRGASDRPDNPQGHITVTTNKKKSHLTGKLRASFSPLGPLFTQEDIRLTNVVVRVKKYFLLAKPLPKVLFLWIQE